MKLTALAAPGVAPSRTLEETFTAALHARGLEGTLVHTPTPADLRTAAAALDEEFVLLTADDTPVADLLPDLTVDVVRVDLDALDLDPSPRVRRHVRWRGTAGVRFGVDDWYFQRTSPPLRIPYGPDPDQYAHLRLPAPDQD